MWHVRQRGEVHTRIWLGTREGKRPLVKTSRRWGILKWILQKWDERAWSGFL